MFFELNNLVKFKNIIKLLNGLYPEVTMFFDKDIGLYLIGIKNYQVIYIKIIPNNLDTFTSFSFAISININTLYKSIMQINDNLNIILEINDTLEYLIIKTPNNSLEKTITLQESETFTHKIHDLGFSSIIELNTREFKKMIKDLENNSDILTVEFNENQCCFQTSSCTTKSSYNFNVDNKVNYKNQYNLQLLSYFSRHLIKISNNISLKFEKDKYLLLEIDNIQYICVPTILSIN